MRKNIEWPDILFWISVFLLALGLVVLETGCQTAKNLPRHNDRFPIAAAEYARKKFPVKESHTIDTLRTSDTTYMEGATVDTTVFCDTLFVTKTVFIKCPPAIHIRDTVTLTATNWMIDGAAAAEAELKLEAATKELKAINSKFITLNSKLTWWKIACIITWSIVALFLALYLSFKLKKI
jgi:hypothetical protein